MRCDLGVGNSTLYNTNGPNIVLKFQLKLPLSGDYGPLNKAYTNRAVFLPQIEKNHYLESFALLLAGVSYFLLLLLLFVVVCLFVCFAAATDEVQFRCDNLIFGDFLAIFTLNVFGLI